MECWENPSSCCSISYFTQKPKKMKRAQNKTLCALYLPDKLAIRNQACTTAAYAA